MECMYCAFLVWGSSACLCLRGFFFEVFFGSRKSVSL